MLHHAVDGCNDVCLHICSQDHVAEGKPEVHVEQATAVVQETPPKGNKQAMFVVWLLFLFNILHESDRQCFIGISKRRGKSRRCDVQQSIFEEIQGI